MIAPVLLILLVSGQAASNQTSAKAANPNIAGAIADGVYANSAFGFKCKVPFGWVDRTQDIQGDADETKSRVLLGVFERPPDAAGSTVNSAIVIAAEKTANYPGLKGALDYFDSLTQLTTAQGFKVVNEPYEFPVGTKKLARSDFSRTSDKLTMQQSSLVMLARGYVISFTFVAGSDDEIDQLIENLTFPAVHK